jgi:hypothetical protein
MEKFSDLPRRLAILKIRSNTSGVRISAADDFGNGIYVSAAQRGQLARRPQSLRQMPHPAL